MKKTKTIRNEREFLGHIEAEDRYHAVRRIYKSTDCGAWISFQEPGRVRSKKKVRWTARVRLSILGIVVLSVRREHGRSTTDIEKLPKEVVEYLCLDLEELTPVRRRVSQTGDQKPGSIFGELEGRMEGGVKVHPFELNGTRKFRGGVTIGSIVEGIDTCATPVELEYPFTEEEYDRAVQSVESEVEHLWNETHGCDDCGIESEYGGNAINPDCKTCHGEGTIL